jgi:hypothetical protein
MRLAVVSAALTAPAVAVASAAPDDDAKATAAVLSQIVLSHEVRTAFYEHAPMKLSAAMSQAVRVWCSSANRERMTDSNTANADIVSWLCANHKLRYFRKVYVTGARGSRALVCEDNGTSSLKYFGTDLVAEIVEAGKCVPAEFDGTRYELQLESVDSKRTPPKGGAPSDRSE